MSLGRVKVWIPGDILTAADLNSEFNNILDNPLTLISPSTGAINFNLQSHTNLLPSAITATSGNTGDIITKSAGGVSVWTANPAFMLVPLNPVSAQFSTANFARLSRSTDSTWPVNRLAFTASSSGGSESALWYVSLTSQISAVSSATIEFFYSATSSGNTTVWSVNTRAVASGSTWNVVGSTNVSTTQTYTAPGELVRGTVALTASSWSYPATMQISIKRLSSDAGNSGTTGVSTGGPGGDVFIHSANLRITV